MLFSELFEQKLYGNYRGQIISQDTDKKNGLYKVRVFPLMADLDTQYLPFAMSNLTNRIFHVNLKVNDWVWLFFEGGDPQYPVIFDLCNFKGSYPLPDTESLSLGTSYGGYNKFNFNNKVKIEIDETNGQMAIWTSNSQSIVIMQDGSIDIKDHSNNEIKMSSSGIDIKASNGSEAKLSTLIQIKNTSASLFNILNNSLTSLSGMTVLDPVTGLNPISAASSQPIISELVNLARLMQA